MSWAMPPDSRRRSTSTNPASAIIRRMSLGRGQVGDRAGQVAVGRAVGQQAPDDRHHLAEVHAVAPAQEPVGRCRHLEQGDAPAGAQHPSQLGEERRQRRPGCAGRSRRSRRRPTPPRTGRRRASPWTSGASVRAAASMPNDRSIPSGARPADASSRHRSPVPQARSSNRRPRPQGQRADRPPPPADVHAERHDAVDQVVPGGDGVEHVPHRPDLVVALGQVRTCGGYGGHGIHNRRRCEEPA